MEHYRLSTFFCASHKMGAMYHHHVLPIKALNPGHYLLKLAFVKLTSESVPCTHFLSEAVDLSLHEIILSFKANRTVATLLEPLERIWHI